MMRGIIAALVLCGLALSSGCGGDSSGNRLYGSVSETYDLGFDRVIIERQDYNGKMVAILVRFMQAPGTNREQMPVKVIVNAPVAQGQEKNLVTEGGLTRAMGGTTTTSEFPKMKAGKLTFDTLSEVGETASGTFYITFEADPNHGLKIEGMLNGEFSATLGQI